MCLDFIPALNKCESRKQTEIDSVYGDKERMKCEGRRRRTMYSLHVTTRVKNCSKNINKTKISSSILKPFLLLNHEIL